MAVPAGSDRKERKRQAPTPQPIRGARGATLPGEGQRDTPEGSPKGRPEEMPEEIAGEAFF